MNQMSSKEALRAIPPINKILEAEALSGYVLGEGREAILRTAKLVLEIFKQEAGDHPDFCQTKGIKSKEEVPGFIASRIIEALAKESRQELGRVINATGIVLHTNLGRAPLPQKAVAAVSAVSEGYSNLEYDLETGRRGYRHSQAEFLIKELTGAESALVVNNNAAAVFLCINTLAQAREVIVSRGQQVEIGGSFRIPDLISSSGAKMVEIGTTNKTHLKDYEKAITQDTRVLLKVHTSNYRVTGFAESVDLETLVDLAQKKGLLVVEDLGSGSLIDLRSIGLPYEPTVQDSIKRGVSLVTFSGDKLLGGPQAGIIAGKKDLIDRIKANPLARMVRPCKMTFAALTSVLKIYLNENSVAFHIPVLKMMALKPEELEIRAEALAEMIKNCLIQTIGLGRLENGSIADIGIVEELDEVGGGSLPGVLLPGRAVSLAPQDMSLDKLQESLRKYTIPILCRIHQDTLLLNVRTIDPDDYKLVACAIADILGAER